MILFSQRTPDSFAWAILIGVLSTTPLWSADTPEENPMVFSTIVDGVDVKIFVPDRVDVFRGALLHSANASFKTSGRWAELCKSQGWVHVVTTMKNVRKQGNRGPRLHKAAVEGLKQCGEAKGHPELAHAPLIGTGHSAGGLVTRVLDREWKRAVAYTIDCSWVVKSEKVSAELAKVPAMFTMGELPDAFKMLPAIPNAYEPARKKGLPWGLGLQPGCKHDWGNAGTMMVPFIKGVANFRIPRDWDPRQGPANLIDMSEEHGWLGDRSTMGSHMATVASWSDYKGDKSAAAWFPDRATAFVWRAWCSKFPPVQLNARTTDGSSKLTVYKKRKGISMSPSPGKDIELGVVLNEDTQLKSVRYFSGDVLIGEATAVPWTFIWKSPPVEQHPVFVEWTLVDGRTGVSNPGLITFITP